jgi:hypothetical protein
MGAITGATAGVVGVVVCADAPDAQTTTAPESASIIVFMEFPLPETLRRDAKLLAVK